MASARVYRYWSLVAAHGCCVCGAEAEIAHCHGGSLTPITGVKAKGKKLAYMDWLVLPACPDHHRILPDSLDLNVRAFERLHGTQVSHINKLIERTKIDVWALAKSRHSWAGVHNADAA